MTRNSGSCELVAIAVVLAVASHSTLVVGQAALPDEVKESYSFGGSQAVASDGGTSDSNQFVFSGGGSGFWVLNGANLQPTNPGPPITDYRVRCHGFVREMKVTPDKVWVRSEE